MPRPFLVWVNEEDHLRIISMQKGGDLKEVYGRLVTAVKEIEKKLPFARDDRFGYLTFCPTNLGTRGEHTESEGGVYDISNKRRLGLTEYQAVREMQDGVLELIKLERDS
ncbi:hypothetical protein MTO96_044684 [Rhipicephalus appendiculatus]